MRQLIVEEGPRFLKYWQAAYWAIPYRNFARLIAIGMLQASGIGAG
jgi:hypothetical protein